MKNIFVDMDGCLAVYDRDAYIARPDTVAEYLIPGYFETCKVDENLVNFLNMLTSLSEDSINLYVLTRVPDMRAVGQDIFQNITSSKVNWMKLKCDLHIEPKNVIITSSSKVAAACQFLKKPKLDKNDILIDDFNNNLVEWKKAGGSSYKYVNGLNSAETSPCLYFGFGSQAHVEPI